MEALFYLLGVVFVVWCIAGPPLLIAAWSRLGRLQRETDDLRRRVARLDALREREERAGTPAGEAPTAARADVATAAPVAPAEPVRVDEPPVPASPESRPTGPRTSSETDPEKSPPAPERRPEPAALVASSAERDAQSDDVRPVAPPPTPPAPRQPIEWERWIGVRGAALLGGVLFALAAVFLYLHAVEQQWITPRSRVIFGTVSGLVLIGASEVMRRKSFRFAPGAVAAAGVVALYASTWAANSLYALIGDAPALIAFVAITAGCVALAVRHSSQAVAVLGLLGGFATPVVLAMPARDPLGLFGYLLLLNVGLVVVGKRQRWSGVAVLGIAATAVIEGVWAMLYAGPEELWIGLVALAALAMSFVALKPRLPQDQHAFAVVARLLTVLPPMVLGVWFAGQARFEASLWSLAAYGAVLQGGAIVLSRRQGDPSVAVLSALALVATMGAWLFGARGGAFTDQFCAVGAAVAAGFVAVARFERTAASRWPAFTILTGTAVLLLGGVAPPDVRTTEFPWAWLGAAAATGLAALASDRETGWWRCVPAALAGVVAAIALGVHFDPGAPTETVAKSALVCALGVAVLMTAAGAWTSRGGDRARIAAAWLAVVPLLATPMQDLVRVPGVWAPAVMLGVAGCLGALSALGRSGVGQGVTALLASLAVVAYWCGSSFVGGVKADVLPGAPERLAVCALIAFLVAWPAVFRARFERSAWAWRGAAPAVAFAMFGLELTMRSWMGDAFRVFAPAGIAAAVVALDLASARRIATDARRSARAWALGTAAPFAAAAAVWWSGGQFENGWVALTAAGLTLAAFHLRHTGLAVWAIVTLAWTVLLYWGAGFQGAYHAGVPFVWNRFGFDALVIVAAAALGLRGAIAARRDEREDDTRPWRAVMRPMPALFAVALALGIFQWIDLSVFERWSEDRYVVLRATHLPARDLTLSTSWIVYGLAWLGVGMWKRVQAARWCSLAILLVSLAKVFLFDLAHLEGLYRVASLFGLGLSLVVVSLLYQRFVFRDDGDAE